MHNAYNFAKDELYLGIVIVSTLPLKENNVNEWLDFLKYQF